MKQRKFTFYFKGGPITVWAFNEEDARILARAEAIKKGWDSTVMSRPTLEKLDMVINWKQLNDGEQVQLHTLLCKAKYNGEMEGE